MSVFSRAENDDHERVVFYRDAAAGLSAIVAIHRSRSRVHPAIGGCRMWPYATEEEALVDVLRLSRGMTYKSAISNLPFGGAKAVIIGDPAKDKNDKLLRAMGRFIESFRGQFVTGEDVGISVGDVEVMRKTTQHVIGVQDRSGDPSIVTAHGVFRGIQAAVRERLGLDDLTGIRVAVQGVGHVGNHLCRSLKEAGARLFVSDIDPAKVARVCDDFGAVAVAPEEIFTTDADVFSPCGLGGILNDETIPRLKATVVAGAANNQLGEPRHGEMLEVRNILYAPDYVVNAGGLLNGITELTGENAEQVRGKVNAIYDSLMEIFKFSRERKVPPGAAADYIAEERMRSGSD